MKPNAERCYEILGLDQGASQEQIKKAWRELAHRWHPDKVSHNLKLQEIAEEEMKHINAAYEFLKLHQPVPQESSSTATGQTYEDVEKGQGTEEDAEKEIRRDEEKREQDAKRRRQEAEWQRRQQEAEVFRRRERTTRLYYVVSGVCSLAVLVTLTLSSIIDFITSAFIAVFVCLGLLLCALILNVLPARWKG